LKSEQICTHCIFGDFGTKVALRSILFYSFLMIKKRSMKRRGLIIGTFILLLIGPGLVALVGLKRKSRVRKWYKKTPNKMQQALSR
jgi:hypothetical protein